MTYREMLAFGRQYLEENEIADADTDARLLLLYVTGMSGAVYLMRMNARMPADEAEKYRQCLRRRAAHCPLQYITHTQGFMGLDFYVDEQVMVPRQDTEILAETALKYLRPGMAVLDMCTGSGCLLISLAASLKIGLGLGADLSEQALSVARINARLNRTEDLVFVQSDLFENVRAASGGRRFDVIVSNPPYIPTAEIPALMPEVREYEPRMALDGHEDGLYFYRKIAAQAANYLNSDGRILFEVGWNQAASVRGILADAGFRDIGTERDLAGFERVVFAVRG